MQDTHNRTQRCRIIYIYVCIYIHGYGSSHTRHRNGRWSIHYGQYWPAFSSWREEIELNTYKIFYVVIERDDLSHEHTDTAEFGRPQVRAHRACVRHDFTHLWLLDRCFCPPLLFYILFIRDDNLCERAELMIPVTDKAGTQPNQSVPPCNMPLVRACISTINTVMC